MKRLPYYLLTQTPILVAILFLGLSFTSTKVFAASAWIDPGSGSITGSTVGNTWSPNFKVSVMVTSYDSEPEMAGATINISYPSNVKVVSIEEGDFDTYVKKDDDPDTHTISIQAVNQAGSYKTGKVRLASIEFTPLADTGNVELTIKPDSVISGAGGEQLLDESNNSVYTLAIQRPDDTTTAGSENQAGTGDSTTTDTTTTGAEIETGVTDSLSIYALISIGLIATGLALGKNFKKTS